MNTAMKLGSYPESPFAAADHFWSDAGQRHFVSMQAHTAITAYRQVCCCGEDVDYGFCLIRRRPTAAPGG